MDIDLEIRNYLYDQWQCFEGMLVIALNDKERVFKKKREWFLEL